MLEAMLVVLVFCGFMLFGAYWVTMALDAMRAVDKLLYWGGAAFNFTVCFLIFKEVWFG